MNPYKTVEDFEKAVAEYTGSPYAVSVDSCTNALFLCCYYFNVKEVFIPSKTYISPALSIMHAGGEVVLETYRNDWSGIYKLDPYPIYDAAKRLTSNMYIPESFMCLSFHIKKPLKIGKGGMILTDDIEAVKWLKKARYEGRTDGVSIYDDNIDFAGWNMYMTPDEAARGLFLLQNYPKQADDLPNNYRDLRTFKLFEKCRTI